MRLQTTDLVKGTSHMRKELKEHPGALWETVNLQSISGSDLPKKTSEVGPIPTKARKLGAQAPAKWRSGHYQ